jgi:hypothetical protein
MTSRREAHLSKVFGDLVKQEGLTAWRPNPQVDEEEVWCDMAQPYCYKDSSTDLTSRRTHRVNRKKSPRDTLQKEISIYKRKNSELSERQLQLKAKQKLLQHQFAKLNTTQVNEEMWRQTSPRRAERKEIEVLREHNARLTEEIKTKDTRNRLVIDKLNRKIAELRDRVDSLKKCRVKVPSESTAVQTEAQDSQVDMMGFDFDHSPKPQAGDSRETENFGSELGRSDLPAVGTARKTVYPNGYTEYHYPNKDIKRVFEDGSIVYYSEESQVQQKISPEGIKITRFPNGQVEKTYADASMKVAFPDGSVKWISSEGETETVYADGVRVKRGMDGSKVVVHPSGVELGHYKPGDNVTNYA